MEADFDLQADGKVKPTARRGRPSYYKQSRAKEIEAKLRDAGIGGESDDDPGDDTDPSSDEGRMKTAVKLGVAKARKEVALAGLNELELKIKTGEYLPRAAYREATATLLATLSQGLRSLPDTLERECGLAPDVLDMVDAVINSALSEVAESLALFTGDVF